MPELRNPEELGLSENDTKMAGLNATPEVVDFPPTTAHEIYDPKPEDENHLANRLQVFFDDLKPEQINQLFDREHDHSCSCIDDRVMRGAVRLPGAGILEGDPEKVAAMLLNTGVKEILSHEGCGAAAMATKKIDESDPSVPRPAWYRRGDVDGNAERFAQAVAEAMNRLRGENSEEEPVTASHLTFYNEGMTGDQHRHTVSVIYYDVTKGGFNRHALQELNLPLGFVVSEHDGSRDEEHLMLAADIAFGKHGATHGFNKDRPLAIMILAQTKDELDEKLRETKEMILNKLPDHVEKIMVNGAIVPLEPKKAMLN